MSSESEQEAENDHNVTSPEIQVDRDQEVKGKRAKTSRDENEVEGIKMVLQDIAEALREGIAAVRGSTAVNEKAQQRLLISEAEIWKLLEDLKIEAYRINRVYLYLLDNPHRIRAVLGCPKNKQKDLLLEMVFGFVAPSR